MVLDAVVGIMDPLRGDVKDAVATAQHAGVMVSQRGPPDPILQRDEYARACVTCMFWCLPMQLCCMLAGARASGRP